MNDKKEFQLPLVEILGIDVDDIIATSGFGTNAPGKMGDLLGEDDPFWN